MVDRLADGRRFRILTVMDQYTRECPVLVADTSLTAKAVVAALSRVVDVDSVPESITVDNGSEFSSRAMDAWAYRLTNSDARSPGPSRASWASALCEHRWPQKRH